MVNPIKDGIPISFSYRLENGKTILVASTNRVSDTRKKYKEIFDSIRVNSSDELKRKNLEPIKEDQFTDK